MPGLHQRRDNERAVPQFKATRSSFRSLEANLTDAVSRRGIGVWCHCQPRGCGRTVSGVHFREHPAEQRPVDKFDHRHSKVRYTSPDPGDAHGYCSLAKSRECRRTYDHAARYASSGSSFSSSPDNGPRPTHDGVRTADTTARNHHHGLHHDSVGDGHLRLTRARPVRRTTS